MIHRRWAVATKVAKLVSAARFPNQYFVGCASSFLPFVLGPFDQQPLLRQRFAALEIMVAGLTRTAAKQDLSFFFGSLRQWMVCHAVGGKPVARSWVRTGWW